MADVTKFCYSPNGDNRGHDSLNHSEVLKIASSFLLEQELMQTILINKYPILLIDESQDTNRLLIDALFSIQEKYKSTFCLGLIGDTMQRIYTDGKARLGEGLGDDWQTPSKQMNHRCPKRVVNLINMIRAQVDNQRQTSRTDAEDGTVRFFIFPSDYSDKADAENTVRNEMAMVTEDPLWSGENAVVKALTLEHHMAARRMGFFEMFEPIHKIDEYQTGLLDGTLPALRFFSKLILPIVQASEIGDDFAISAVVQKHSPLLEKATLRRQGKDQIQCLENADNAVKQLKELWKDSASPSFMDVLKSVHETGLFVIPDAFQPILMRTEEEVEIAKALDGIFDNEDVHEPSNVDAWDIILQTSFSQISDYDAYVNGNASFDTHQGIKGHEFERVMVIMDDAEAVVFYLVMKSFSG